MNRKLADSSLNPVVVESQGGLGNQLFILAYALRLREESGLPIVLDVSHYQLNSARRFELTPYLQRAGFSCQQSTLGTSWITKPLLRLKLSTHSARFDPGIIRETSLAFDPRLLRVKAGERVRAYAQSWRYLPADTSLLTSIFGQHAETNREIKHRGFKKWEDAVAVHVRRGDYKKSKAGKSHPLLAEEYYGASLSLVRERLGPLRPVVFSDSPGEALQLIRRLPLGKNARVAPPGHSPIELLSDLSSLDALVMANSSLSWWAAWRLGFHSDRVVAPRVWSNRSDFVWEDLIPEGTCRSSAR